MAEENKIIWPEGSAEVESVQDFEWLMAGKTGQPLRKIHKDKYKNYLSITGIEMKPVATGSLPLGPSGQERKMIIQSAGVWTYGGNNFVNPVGEIMTLWWNGTTWSVADRAVLPIGKDGRDITEWESKAYAFSSSVPKVSFLVFKDGIIWENNATTLSTDIPGISPKWLKKAGINPPEYYNELEKFNELTGGYDVNDDFIDNSNNWTIITGYTVPFTIANNLLTMTLTANANNGVQMLRNLEVGKTYPIEVKIRATGAQKIVNIGTTFGASLTTNFVRLSDLTEEFKVYNFSITPLSGSSSRICIGIMNTQNLGGTIEVEYIKVGSEVYGDFKLQSMKVLDKLNKQHAEGYDSTSRKQALKGSYVTEYSYTSLYQRDTAIIWANGAVANTVGYSTSFLIDLGDDWERFDIVPPTGTAYTHRLFRANRSPYNSVRGGAFSTDVPTIVLRADMPEAKFIQICFKDSEIDNFKFFVLRPSNKELIAEVNKDVHAIANGKKVLNIQFNKSNFPINGYTHPSSGGTIVAEPNYMTTGLRPLPDNWSQIQLLVRSNNIRDRFNIYDAMGRFLAAYHGANAADVFPTVIQRNLAPRDSYYYAYAYNTTGLFNDLTFIIDESISNNKKIVEPLIFNMLGHSGTRLANTNLKDFNDKGIVPEVVLDKTTIPGALGGARIPSTIITNLNTVIVASEIRLDTFGDAGRMDVVIKRKVSGSSTWQLINVFPNDSVLRGRAMNPSFVIDRTGVHGIAGRIYLFVCTVVNPNQLASDAVPADLDTIYRYSDDDGVSWSPIESIKDKWNKPNECGLSSPSNGIQLADGTLVFPSFIVRSKSYSSGVFFKKVDGDWTFSNMSSDGIDIQGMGDNECAVIEYNGKVLVNCRFEGQFVNKNLNRRVYEVDFESKRLLSHQTDRTFYPYMANQMSLAKISIPYQEFTTTKFKTVYLATGVDNSAVFTPVWNRDRKNITIWASLDLFTWIRVYVAWHDATLGYSVISVKDQITPTVDQRISLAHEYNLDSQTSIAYQDLTSIIPDIRDAVFTQLNRSTEEKLNELIYKSKGWTY
ncbi:sialidase family protein [Sphingobacterium faecium]|uniref:sialidase family protein n=1 Tax=Sphingobacterium faecium TaxID=34087 RepID=UPI0032093C97